MAQSNTGRLILEGTIRLLKGVSHVPSSAELGCALIALNDLLMSWSIDGIMVPVHIAENFPLVVAQSSYTIGVGGTFNTVRPIKILDSTYIRDSNNIDHPVTTMTRERYNEIMLKSNEGRPEHFYYMTGYPLGTIYFDLKPQVIETIYFNFLKHLTEITDISAVLLIPPEYQRALRYNLAVELAPELGISDQLDLIIANADQSKGSLERINSQAIEEAWLDIGIRPRYTLADFNAGI